MGRVSAGEPKGFRRLRRGEDLPAPAPVPGQVDAQREPDWKAFTPKTVDNSRCVARTWDAGRGGQCPRLPSSGTDGVSLCEGHRAGLLPHGLVTGPIPAAKLSEFQLHAVKEAGGSVQPSKRKKHSHKSRSSRTSSLGEAEQPEQPEKRPRRSWSRTISLGTEPTTSVFSKRVEKLLQGQEVVEGKTPASRAKTSLPKRDKRPADGERASSDSESDSSSGDSSSSDSSSGSASSRSAKKQSSTPFSAVAAGVMSNLAHEMKKESDVQARLALLRLALRSIDGKQTASWEHKAFLEAGGLQAIKLFLVDASKLEGSCLEKGRHVEMVAVAAIELLRRLPVQASQLSAAGLAGVLRVLRQRPGATGQAVEKLLERLGLQQRRTSGAAAAAAPRKQEAETEKKKPSLPGTSGGSGGATASTSSGQALQTSGPGALKTPPFQCFSFSQVEVAEDSDGGAAPSSDALAPSGSQTEGCPQDSLAGRSAGQAAAAPPTAVASAAMIIASATMLAAIKQPTQNNHNGEQQQPAANNHTKHQSQATGGATEVAEAAPTLQTPSLAVTGRAAPAANRWEIGRKAAKMIEDEEAEATIQALLTLGDVINGIVQTETVTVEEDCRWLLVDP
ncbi:unnamed protein product [Polarella glacialis]|uniref:Uncharacterized protein n=1 Tax=Polarella glacialis TaxID=89957 RepID=A0A813H7I1_POLGL|nr:unnamed protein product [Polarella glacialis]